MASQKVSQSGGTSILYVVAYILTWITGVIVFLIAKPTEKRLKFNGLQAIFLGIIIFILDFIPIVGWLIAIILWIVGVVAGIKAYQGQDMVLPVIGDWAKKYSG
jgi:uncharacterized membrane protein